MGDLLGRLVGEAVGRIVHLSVVANPLVMYFESQIQVLPPRDVECGGQG